MNDNDDIDSVASPSEDDRAPITNNLAKAYLEIIISLAGNSITDGPSLTSKELTTMVFLRCRKYLQEGRFNLDLAAELEKRKNTFQPHVKLVPIERAAKEYLVNTFFAIDDNGQPEGRNEANAGSLWTRFEKIKSFAKNVALPKYQEKYKPNRDSGTYNDEAAIQAVWEAAIKKTNKENAQKCSHLNQSIYTV